MSDEVGFVTMAAAKASGEIPEIGVGLLGYAFMGKAHTNAYKTIPYMIYPPPAMPRLVAIAGRSAEGVQEAAKRYGYEKAIPNWRRMIRDDRVQLFDNSAPNNVHAAPCIAAAAAGKHILCEKPLARSTREAARMLEAVTRAGVKHMVGFNYRFVPALRQVRQWIEQALLGEIFHFRAVYLQEWVIDPTFPMIWRLNEKQAGNGALGDLGAHIIDLARWLVGEPARVSAMTRIFVPERPLGDGSGQMARVTVDDAFAAVIEFENGALGTLEASRFCPGRKNAQVLEINGSKGSVVFNLERINELQVFWKGEQPKESQGFHDVLVSESYHPFWSNWWPQGHMIGWEHTFIHEITHLLSAIVHDKAVAPYGADFNDGYKNAVICDAILKSAATEKQVRIRY